ncbi:MAG: helix-turn-helix domain-containing protein [Dysgonomonas sp.]
MIEPLLELFCNINNLSIQDIKGRSRKNGLPLFRHVYAYIVRTETNATLQSIANTLERNHDTILYGINKISDYLSVPKFYPDVKKMVDTFSILYNQSTEEARLTESDHTTSETLEKLTHRVLGRLSPDKELVLNQSA